MAQDLRHSPFAHVVTTTCAAPMAAVRPAMLGAEDAGVALSVVVPMHDEEENVAALVTEIRAALGDSLDYEIVLVDDGSRDATLHAMQLARERHGPRVRIVRHDRN